MIVHSKVEVMEEVVKVNFPVKFSICRLWEGTTCLFTAAPTLQKFLIDIERCTQLLSHFVVEVTLEFHYTLGSLVVHLGLPSIGVGFIVFLGNH
jgi:hypothetical protein